MEAPMFSNKYLAHALGGYKGYKYLNNELALKHSARLGHKYFEIDFTLTEDGYLVPSHGWNKANAERSGLVYSPDFEHMTKDLFLKQKVHGMPTMDTETLYRYMKKHPSFYWELDLHTLTKEKAIEVTQALLKDFHNDTELFDRFLVQANSPEMFEGIDSVYHFKYYQLFLKKGLPADDLDAAIDYCKSNGICSVALSAKDAKKETINLLKNNGLKILIYSLDDQKKADHLIKLGADTICTNSLSPYGDKILKIKRNKIVKSLRKIKNSIHKQNR